MSSDQPNILSDFEEKEKQILDFEKTFIQQQNELRELKEKYQLLEEQSSKENVEKIAHYEEKLNDIKCTLENYGLSVQIGG